MSQVLYEHTTPQTAAADLLRHHNITAASAASIMAAGSDPEPLEQPVATGDAKSHQSHSSHSTATHYVGLPYQDHNYGAPPPPTPPQSPPPSPAPPSVASAASIFTSLNGIVDVEKPIAIPSIIPPAVPFPAPEPVDHKDEGETRCICNFEHDDGYMICCDRCGVWQHVECMGLERNNIPDNYFCEKCQPRPVDRIKAHELQSKKRELIHSDSSTDSGDEDTSVAPTTATYMAISNSPTSLTLTAKHKKLKKKKKKRSREKEHLDEKHHKRKKRRHSSRKTSSSSTGNKPEESAASGVVQIMDETARPPWHEESDREQHDRYEEAAFNQYSADIQHLVATHCQKQAPSINSIRQPKLRTLGQKAVMGNLGKNTMGLVAKEELKKNEFIMEFKGKVMLSDQLDMKLPFFNRPNPFVLMYSKFSKLNICVDASIYGNEARFVRRSCNPNAEIRHSFEDNTIHLSLYSLGNVNHGTEVTIAFDYNYKGCSVPVRCACNKKTCTVKRFRRKHHSEDGQNHKTSNHHITREPVEMMTKSNSNPSSLSSSNHKKRTVSPLRVSLSAHNEQNNAEPQPEKPKVNGDNSTHTTTPAPSSTDTSTQENEKQSSEQPTAAEEQTTPAAPTKKLTREERKMEAIMKAIEKMEKTEQRRQQALERIAVTKHKEQNDEVKPDQPKPDGSTVTSLDSKESTPQEPAAVKKEQQVKSINSSEENSNSALPVPQVAAKPRPNNRRRRKGSSRRRSRVNSAASTTTTSGASSMDEESNSAIVPTISGSTSAVPTSTDIHQLLTTAPKTTTPSTTTPANVSLTITASLPFQPEHQSLQSIPACSKHFKFPKTKKFFMNEWLNEKALEASANKPLSIKTESLDMFSASVSSPSTPTQVLSKSSTFATTTPVNKTNFEGSLGGSLGSAKKRWLRQAMSDNNMKTTTPPTNDLPHCNGTLSPHHPASPALSPNSSMNDVMMTPLKKRMLRHSIAEDRISVNHQASTPPPLVAQDKPATAPSTPTVESSKLSLDETLKTSEAIKDEVELNSANRLELCFDGLADGKKRTVPVPLPIPARKDFRKNSSLDSGLSVTTPGDFDRSPISVAGADHQTPPELCIETSKDSVVKCDASSSVVTAKVTDIEDRTSERTSSSSPDERHSVECKKEAPSVEEEQNQNSVQDRTAKELDKPDLDKSTPGGITNQSPDRLQPDCQTPVRKLSSASTGTAQIRLDFSLSESQSSLSSLERSHGSMPDLNSSCASAPELQQPPVADEGATHKTNLSHSASSANFERTPTKKADVCASVYSTPPRRLTDEDQSNVNEDLLNSRTRRASGPGDFRKRALLEADPTRRRSRSGFSDDQISGNTNLYTSFASPKKKTLMMMRNSEALAAQEQQQQTSEKTETSADLARTFDSLPDRTDLDGNSDLKDHHVLSEPSKHSSPPPTLAGASNNVPSSSIVSSSSLSRTSSMTSLPGSGSTPPPPPGQHLGLTSPGRSSGDVSPVLNSPIKHLIGSPAAGSRLSPVGSLSPAVVSPPPGMPPVKRKVSLLEYRKRKVSSTGGKASSAPTSSSSTSSVSAPTTPIKPSVPASPKPGLPTLPALPIKSGLSTRPALPIKPGLSSLPAKSGLPSLPTLPIFNMKSKALAEEPAPGPGPGPKCRRLSLTTDAVQAITSLTSFLKEKIVKPTDNKLPQDDNWRSNKPASGEDPLQKLRKELDEKNRERERRDSHNSLKRPLSPEPPPPPPSKKPSLQPPTKKANTGLRLQIPPPPPPKIKASSESARSGDLPSAGDSSSDAAAQPVHATLTRPKQHKSPGSAGTPPVAAAVPITTAPGTPPPPARKPPTAVPGTPPVRVNPAIPGTPPVRMNLAGIPGTAPVRTTPAAIPGTPPVRMNPAGIPGTPPVRTNPAAIPGTPPVRMNPAGIPGTPPVRPNLAAIPGTPPVRMNPASIPSTPVRTNHSVIPGTPPVRINAPGIPGTPPVRVNPAAVPMTPPPPPLMGNIVGTPPVQTRPNAMHPTYPQASSGQPYNPNYNQQQQQQPQQQLQYQPGANVPVPHQYPPPPPPPQQQQQLQQPVQQAPPPPPQLQPVQQPPVAPPQAPVVPPQQIPVTPAAQPIPVVSAQVVPPPPPAAPGQQIPVLGGQQPQQHPPPPPQQAYNYQGYANQTQQQVYPPASAAEKQGTAAVIEQFTKFHNQQQQHQQQQHTANQQQYQQQYNAAYQHQAQTYQQQAGPPGQQQQQYHNPNNQTHYNTAGAGQQHKNSNSYSPRHSGYYQ